MSEIVDTQHYLHTTLTNYARYNKKLSRYLIDVNKLFKVVGNFHVEVYLNQLNLDYHSKFINHNHLGYMEKFISSMDKKLFGVMLTYDLKEGQIFVFDFIYQGAIYRKEIKLYYFSKVL